MLVAECMRPIINGPFTFIKSRDVWVMGYSLQVVGTQGLSDGVTPTQLVKAFESMRALFVAQRRAQLDDDGSPAWIGAMLPSQVMTQIPADWRPPTPWEMRHVAGTGSFARISMQRGSELVGVNLQSFKRYASEGPKAHRISFAAWHLLLHRLGIQSLPTEHQSWCG